MLKAPAQDIDGYLQRLRRPPSPSPDCLWNQNFRFAGFVHACCQRCAMANLIADQAPRLSWHREAEAAKKAEQARKKAERDAQLADEEKSTPGRSAPKNAKSAVKKTRALDLSQLDDGADKDSPLAALNASGIDNALDALSLTGATSSDNAKIDRHPERRFKAAYGAFEERRLKEMETDGTGQGLRLNQKKEKIKKEFDKSPENPFNQVSAKYDSTKEQLAEIREQEKAKIESRLGSK
jgi:hypothetical protein